MPSAQTTTHDNADTTPQTQVERELVRNLLAGLRKFEKRGIRVDHEWCRVRRAPRADQATMTVEFDSRDAE